jgi:hypothetical protein
MHEEVLDHDAGRWPLAAGRWGDELMADGLDG